MPTMKAAVFVEPNRIMLDEKPIPDVGAMDALLRIITTTICGTGCFFAITGEPVTQGR